MNTARKPRASRARWLVWCATIISAGALAFTPTTPDPERAMQDFLKAYWDAEFGYFLAWNNSAPFARPDGSGPKSGKYADFWWAAQLWDVVLDAHERNPTPEYRKLIDDVYDGFVRQYPEWQNDYNDDLGWWAQASMRAWAITQNPRYLERAQKLFDEIWTYWDTTSTPPGGVTWRRSNRDQRNVATNGPLCVIAVRLYQATQNPVYLERAQKLWDFVNDHLTDGDARVFDNLERGELRRWDFTYNVGNFVLASLALREVTMDEAINTKLLERSVKAMDWLLENLTNDGIMLDEGTGDGGGFKGVTLRALRKLIDAPGLEATTKTRLEGFLNANATSIWNARREDGLVGSDWSSMHGRGVIESMTAASAVTALQLARGPLTAQVPTVNGRYEAENSVRFEVASSIKASGYSGRGYINGFYKLGQLVAFRVNVPKTGQYALKFRYSAGGGLAVRSLLTSNQQPYNLEFAFNVDWSTWQRQTLEFAATPDWFTWAEHTVTLGLSTGSNAIVLRFERDPKNLKSASKNWLNLDRLSVQEAP